MEVTLVKQVSGTGARLEFDGGESTEARGVPSGYAGVKCPVTSKRSEGQV